MPKIDISVERNRIKTGIEINALGLAGMYIFYANRAKYSEIVKI